MSVIVIQKVYPFLHALEHFLDRQVFGAVFLGIEFVHVWALLMVTAASCLEISRVGTLTFAGHVAVRTSPHFGAYAIVSELVAYSYIVLTYL